MRNDAPLLLVLTIAILVPSRLPAESSMPLGKPAAWETWGEEAKPASSSSPALIVESMETPNQRRQRLGLAIEPSFPTEDTGVTEETPNQRRHRLELAAEDSLARAR